MRRVGSRWLVTSFVGLLALLFITTAIAQSDFGQPVPGQRVYDRAGVLSAEQIASLEQRAAAVEDAGAPAFVYLQARETNVDETIDDARGLMDEWDVQSATGARDGVVIFFNLEPDDLEHGDYAVVAGESLIEGNVPQRELDRITDQMQPLLEDADIAGAIGLALDAIERDLRDGPPPPPPPSTIERFSDNVADGAFSILNIIAVGIAAVAGWFLVRAFPTRRKSHAPVVEATYPPNDTLPALAGALVTGSVTDANISATLLDLAARGALAVEPDGKKKVRIRLIDGSVVRPGYETSIWSAFEQQADADGVVTGKQIGKVRSAWGGIRTMIDADMVERGWFDPNASRKRMPFYVAALGLFAIGMAAFIITAIAESFWGLGAAGLLGVAAVLAISVGMSIPTTTPDGDEAAASWRGYKRYLKSAGKNPQADLDFDTAMPYAVALGAGSALDKRLKAASADGYLPVWLGGSQADNAWATGFYPYWIAFNSSVSPTSVSTSPGASSGSGASGGSF